MCFMLHQMKEYSQKENKFAYCINAIKYIHTFQAECSRIIMGYETLLNTFMVKSFMSSLI